MIARELLDKLVDHMKLNGLTPTDFSQIRGSGKVDRFHVLGDRKGSKNGWVMVRGGKYPCATYGSWAVELPHIRWSAADECRDELTSAQLREVERYQRMLDQEAKQKEAAVRAKARQAVVATWKAASKTGVSHPYLKEKGIEAHTTREIVEKKKKVLLVPFRDSDGKLQTLQRIYWSDEDKAYAKRFFAGTRKKGTFLQLGGEPKWKMVIAEGFATAASIFEATGITTLDAGGRGDLLPVAQAMRKKYPLIDIVIAADDDQAKALLKGTANGGIDFARETAIAVGGRMAVPSFGNRPPSTKRTDFNDMKRVLGAKEVSKAIANADVVFPHDGFEVNAVDAKKFVNARIVPRKMLVSPWLPAGGAVQIHGQREAGKTFFELGLIAALTSGTKFLCWDVPQPVSVLFVDGEMPQADLRQRVKAALESTGAKQCAPWKIVTPDLQPFVSPDLSDERWRDAIERTAGGYEVIVLDSVSTLLKGPVSMNDAASWAPIQEWMLRLRRKGHSIVWIHHDGKSGHQLGTITRETILDTSIQLAMKKRLDEGIEIELGFTKARGFYGKDASALYLTLKTGPDGRQVWSWSGKSGGRGPEVSRKKEEVLRLAKEGKKFTVIAGETNVPPTTVARWVKEQKPAKRI